MILDGDVRPWLRRKEVIAYYFLFFFGYIIFYLPYMLLMLALFIIISPSMLILGEPPKWFLKIIDVPGSTYGYWLRERYRKKAVNNRDNRRYK